MEVLFSCIKLMFFIQIGWTEERVTSDLDRKRVNCREAILKQGEQLMSELGSSRSMMKIQYKGNVGTCLSPGPWSSTIS